MRKFPAPLLLPAILTGTILIVSSLSLRQAPFKSRLTISLFRSLRYRRGCYNGIRREELAHQQCRFPANSAVEFKLHRSLFRVDYRQQRAILDRRRHVPCEYPLPFFSAISPSYVFPIIEERIFSVPVRPGRCRLCAALRLLAVPERRGW